MNFLWPPRPPSFLTFFRNQSMPLRVSVLGEGNTTLENSGWQISLVKPFCFADFITNGLIFCSQYFFFLLLGVWNNMPNYFETNKQGKNVANLFTLALLRRCLVNFQHLVNNQCLKVSPAPLTLLLLLFIFFAVLQSLEDLFSSLSMTKDYFLWHSPRAQQQLKLLLCERLPFI